MKVQMLKDNKYYTEYKSFLRTTTRNIESFNIYQSVSHNPCSDWLKFEVNFASTEKLYCDVIYISTPSIVGNNPVGRG